MDTIRPQCVPFGDQAIRISFGDNISFSVHKNILHFCSELERRQIKGIVEWVPTYHSVTIYYDPVVYTYDEINFIVEELYEKSKTTTLSNARFVTIPVLYDEEVGPDLQKVAQFHQLPLEKIIEIHSSRLYLVFMIGFTPGFPYLGGMDEAIAIPRLETPRILVQAGSVGIAGNQTGIYSVDSPGGWHIIGRTPVPLFEMKKNPPVLLKAGDFLLFAPITKQEFNSIEEQVKQKKYKPLIKTIDEGEIDEISSRLKL
ncbi:5-oxoprolinase subunit PxpB [Alkalihalobacillus sp. LMS39]|uniref:5-oxoprolinase subunit PxpB n=1 Tax=Alkalihalobacillus sp. LMS39 TaxID=2924032 RepID=UPI001FB4678E|nr:5-oxoprolinase subunit PxpB [Alkalihalobacillus sp. LMS39]UOE92378.1 5-oxoprolinase subunit PxpB [Alkalihalobacillus sp. LMS39]